MTHSTEASLNNVTAFLFQLIQDWNPAVIIISGDVALDKVALPYLNLKKSNQSIPRKLLF